MHAESERLGELGVGFTQAPTTEGDAVMAIVDDTCGNLVVIVAESR